MSTQQQTTRPVWSDSDRERMTKLVQHIARTEGSFPVWKDVVENFPGHSVGYVRRQFGSTARLLAKTDSLVEQSLKRAREHKKETSQKRPKKAQKKPVNSKKLNNVLAQLQRLTAVVKAMKSGASPKQSPQKKAKLGKPRPRSQMTPEMQKNDGVSRKLFESK